MIRRLFRLILLIAVASLSAKAQNSTMSPYSRFGYGLLNDNATSMQRAMGGVGYAMNSGRQINVMNPASYAAIDSLTFLFDMGVNIDMMHASEQSASENSMSGGLDYITMSFPISHRIGASLGLLPWSSTGYAFADSIGNGSTSHQGSGSINQIYAGVGVNPFAGLYLGANVAYLFGSTLNDVYAYTINGSTSLFQRYMSVRNMRLDFGIQYSANIGADRRLTLGLSYSPEMDLRGETYGIYYDATLDARADTVGYTNLKGNFTTPASYGAGINYTIRDRLIVEADFTYQPWKDAKYRAVEDFEVNEFDNRWKAAIGAQYTPSPRGTYAQRIQYRVGAYYDHDYLMVRGNNVREIGATLGFGIPVPGFKSIINLGLQYKHRQASPQALIKEDYLTVTLGINFNELWFRKSRIY